MSLTLVRQIAFTTGACSLVGARELAVVVGSRRREALVGKKWKFIGRHCAELVRLFLKKETHMLQSRPPPKAVPVSFGPEVSDRVSSIRQSVRRGVLKVSTEFHKSLLDTLGTLHRTLS